MIAKLFGGPYHGEVVELAADEPERFALAMPAAPADHYRRVRVLVGPERGCEGPVGIGVVYLHTSRWESLHQEDIAGRHVRMITRCRPDENLRDAWIAGGVPWI